MYTAERTYFKSFLTLVHVTSPSVFPLHSYICIHIFFKCNCYLSYLQSTVFIISFHFPLPPHQQYILSSLPSLTITVLPNKTPSTSCLLTRLSPTSHSRVNTHLPPQLSVLLVTKLPLLLFCTVTDQIFPHSQFLRSHQNLCFLFGRVVIPFSVVSPPFRDFLHHIIQFPPFSARILFISLQPKHHYNYSSFSVIVFHTHFFPQSNKTPLLL